MLVGGVRQPRSLRGFTVFNLFVFSESTEEHAGRPLFKDFHGQCTLQTPFCSAGFTAFITLGIIGEPFMRQIICTSFLLAISLLAHSATEPETLCETRTGTIPTPSYKHCKSGDLVEVDAFEVPRRCSLTGTVVSIKDKFLCVYRGEKRTIRKRPLTDVEKAYDRQQLDPLMDKYID